MIPGTVSESATTWASNGSIGSATNDDGAASLRHHDSIRYDALMRTTVTLDPDVAAKLKRAARERDISFKEALNTNLRRGLESGAPSAARPYRISTRQLGIKPGFDLDRAVALAGRLEDAETARKLSVRK